MALGQRSDLLEAPTKRAILKPSILATAILHDQLQPGKLSSHQAVDEVCFRNENMGKGMRK